MSNEAISFDDLYLLKCHLNNEEVALGRWLQWRISLISDNVSRSICIGGIISRIAQYFGIALDHFDSTPYSLIDKKFIRNSNQFKKVNNLFVWKNEEAVEEEHDQDIEDINLIGNVGLENVALEEEQDTPQVQTPPPPPSSPRKRARASSS